MAAYLNSRPVDEHLRSVLGSTQVNAIELRNLPVPDLDALDAIGRRLGSNTSADDAVAGAGTFSASELSARHA